MNHLLDPAPVTSAVGAAVADVSASIGPVAVIGLGVGGTILAFTIGWRLVKRFAR
jgi:hypothetical protein